MSTIINKFHNLLTRRRIIIVACLFVIVGYMLMSGPGSSLSESVALQSGVMVQGAERVDEQAAVVVQCAERFCREDIPQPTPSPRRHRKPRKPLAAVYMESRNDDTEEPVNNRAWLQYAGYLSAASVVLLIIWQTGLIIPLGLIGLATSGFLK